MKKAFWTLLTVGLLSACSNDDDTNSDTLSCTQAIQDVSNALAAFTADPSTANCVTFRTALESQRDVCGDATGVITAQLVALTQC
jgi:hypothetical protein